MPELPDVEGFRQLVASCAVGRRIRRVEVIDPGVLHGISPSALHDALSGHRFGRPERHGKWLIAHTDGPIVLLHFGMTGDLRWSGDGEPRHRHDRVVFVLDGGELRYRDMRKLHGLRIAHNAQAVRRALSGLGPDALTIGRDDLDRLLAGRQGMVKTALVDQSLLAGLGNLLADEILWRAGVHPRRAARDLSDGERGRLYRRMRSVLDASVRAGRVPPRRGWLTGVRDDRDSGCPRCGTPLSHGRVGGRGTVWCSQCQPQ